MFMILENAAQKWNKQTYEKKQVRFVAVEMEMLFFVISGNGYSSYTLANF